VIKGCLELFNIMNIIGRPASDTLKSLKFNTMTLEQAYPVGGGAIGEEMPQIGEDPGGYPSQARILYWYHPDYIQNVDLVTDLDSSSTTPGENNYTTGPATAARGPHPTDLTPKSKTPKLDWPTTAHDTTRVNSECG
jgi:hypothetical protein